MRIFRGINNLPKFTNAVVTIGSYDGLHLGHRHVINQLKETAKKVNGESVVITFNPHPRSIIFPKDESLQLLNTLEEKILLFQDAGIDNLVIVPFSVEFSQIDPREYIENFLINKFNPRYIIIGYDHKFGLNRQGSIHLLREYIELGKREIIEIPAQAIKEMAVSSTKIRNALNEGDVVLATNLLGRKYSMTGEVVHGQKIGTSLGFPTANLKLAEATKLIPSDGIYAVTLKIENVDLEGMMYVGKKPTLDNPSNKSGIEINIFDFQGNIYGKQLMVEIVDFVRDDMAFDNLDQLKDQITQDEIRAREILNIKDRKQKPAKVAIVILNYNGNEYLESFLPSMEESYSKEFDIVIIDNASTDDSIDYLEEWHPEIELIKLDKNYGFAGGYNEGLKQVNAEFYVILNSDILVTPNWLDPIIDLMSSDISIGVCQPKIKSLEEKNKFEYAGAAGGMIDSLAYPFCIGRIFDTVEEDNGQYNEIQDIFWASGAAMIIRKKVFDQFEGFDADFFAHQEEIDLCWRLKRAGYSIKSVNTSHIYHLGGGTLAYDSPRKTYLNFRNNLVMLFKNDDMSSLIWKWGVRKVLDFVAIIQYILRGNFKNAKAVSSAYWYNFWNFPKTWKKRKHTQKIVDKYRIGEPNMDGKIDKWIIHEYFVKGNKKWSDING